AAIARGKGSLEGQRLMLERIVASLGEGFLGLSPQGKIVFANERVAEMFGSRGRLIGKSFLEVARKQSLVDAFDKALRGEASSDRTTILVDSDDRHVEIRVFPVATSAEIAAVALFIDITQLQRL